MTRIYSFVTAPFLTVVLTSFLADRRMGSQYFFDAMGMRESHLQNTVVDTDDDTLTIDLVDHRIAVSINIIFRFFLALIPDDDILIEDGSGE